MALRKITENDLAGRGVIGMADTPGLSAREMQEKVEEVVRSVVIPIVNANVDETVTREYLAEVLESSGAGDMVKIVYDTDGDGVVDDAQRLGGKLPEYYMPARGGEFTGPVTLAADPGEDMEAATKQYVDNGRVLLWENASPASNFRAQTIALDLAGYRFVSIEYRFNTEYTYRKSMVCAVAGTVNAMDIVSKSGYTGVRMATVNNTGISFETASYNNNTDVVGYIIPTAIYGIR